MAQSYISSYVSLHLPVFSHERCEKMKMVAPTEKKHTSKEKSSRNSNFLHLLVLEIIMPLLINMKTLFFSKSGSPFREKGIIIY